MILLPDYLTYVAFSSGVIQLIGGAIFFLEILSNIDAIRIGNNFTTRLLFYIFLASLIFKFILQAASGLNKSNHIIFINRDIVIAYIHLVMLGFTSCGLFYWLISQGFLKLHSFFDKSGMTIIFNWLFSNGNISFLPISDWYY